MKKTYDVFVGVILLSLLLAGCATTRHLTTPSGKPEVTINTADRSKIKSVIINEFMNAGFTLVSESDYSIVFSRPMEGFGGIMYQALAGNSYSSTPEWSIRITIATVDNSTRVMAQAFIKMQNVFGKENVNSVTDGKPGIQLQDMLECVKTKIESNGKLRG